MTKLDLNALNQLPHAQLSGFPERSRIITDEQLRLLLDLVDALGNRLEEMDEWHGGYPVYIDGAQKPDPLTTWREAKKDHSECTGRESHHDGVRGPDAEKSGYDSVRGS